MTDSIPAQHRPKAPPVVPLWLLALFTFSGTLAMHIFVPALPHAARDLGAGLGSMQLTVSLYILGLAFGGRRVRQRRVCFPWFRWTGCRTRLMPVPLCSVSRLFGGQFYCR